MSLSLGLQNENVSGQTVVNNYIGLQGGLALQATHPSHQLFQTITQLCEIPGFYGAVQLRDSQEMGLPPVLQGYPGNQGTVVCLALDW